MAEKVKIKAFFMDFCPSDGAYFCPVFLFFPKSLKMPPKVIGSEQKKTHPKKKFFDGDMSFLK